MRFAAYISNQETANLLLRLLEDYRQERGSSFTCQFYKNELDLLSEYTPGAYDVLVFSGVSDAAMQEIRGRDRQIRLVNIVPAGTGYKDTPENLWYCLPEPLEKLFLSPMLDKLFAEVQGNTQTGMIVKTRFSVLHLPFDRLEFVEVLGRTILFHLTDGSTEEASGTFAEYEARLLQWPDFFKVHRAYIVNLRYIAKLTTDGIQTRFGCSVPVAARLYVQLRRNYLSSLMLPGTELTQGEPAAEVPSEYGGLYHILLVDDEESERLRWSEALLARGCTVRTADTGAAALALAARERFDCVVLDVNMGRERGFDLCAALGEATGAPVVFLSVLTDYKNQEQGFLTGGTDYITKDVSADLFWLKLETRIKLAGERRAELCSGGLRLELKGRRAFLQGQSLALTSVEFDLLHLLMQSPGTVHSPERLYRQIWGSRQWDDGHTVQFHLSQLCGKLEAADGHRRYMETVWGKGYRFVPQD